MNIAFFDFDGTITKKDSLFLFVEFIAGKRRFYWGMISHIHILLGYVLGILSNEFAKQKLSEYFLAGFKKQDFEQKCLEFLPLLKTILKDSAMKQIEWHQTQGDTIVLVSATFENYLKPLADELKIGCIGTILEVKEGYLSGKFASLNCYGKQKVARIKEIYDLKNYEKIYAYGDSRGDKEMLALALEENRFYKNFK